ncbi:MAG: mevalonate kinase [Anaerolineae bacterium]|nr:mevalonate kinase [Anaerolineae bacterium]
MSHVTVSAPGKLMLLGEHAVVYGYACLVTAVNLRVRVTVAPRDDGKVAIATLDLPEPFAASVDNLHGSSSEAPQAVRFVVSALQQFWRETGALTGADIATASDFTQAYGLGSSSAVTAATIKALAEATGRGHALDASDIFRLGFAAVLDVQGGIGSGFDVAAATYGGTLYYAGRGAEIVPLPGPPPPLVVGYSGIKAPTTRLVQHVAALRARRPEAMDAGMRHVDDLVGEAQAALLDGDYAQLGRIMDTNQAWLDTLGVGTAALDKLITAARRAGAYGAKLSGAGGGDCMIALVNDATRPRVERAIAQAGVPGAEVLRVEMGAPGVQVEPL